MSVGCALRKQDNLLFARRVAVPMAICQAAPKKRPISGCMKAMRKWPPAMPRPTG